MRILDLTEEHQSLYLHCLEEWSDEMKEAGDRKECWYCKSRQQGLRVKLAEDDSGVIGGMIQYLPIEHSLAEGEDLYFILCIWVHGHKQGPGNLQKRGMGKALLQAAEADVRDLGAKGIAAWGLWIPVWMKASWFKKHGYKKADRDGVRVLLWKPFTDDARPPRWIRQQKKPVPIPGQVTVTAFSNGWCQAGNITMERAKRACNQFGDQVVFEMIDTSERTTFLEWGISDALFIDGKNVTNGPPLAYERIETLIERRARRWKR